MKRTKITIGAVLLTAMAILFLNCKKDAVIPPPSNFAYSTFTDSRDGKVYKSIRIGNQEWMAENLAYKTESGSWTYWNDANYGLIYGRLYTWEAAKLAVPSGWHIPTDAEWKQLEMLLGMSQTDADRTDFRGTNEGSKLKGTSGWAEKGNGTNDVGFNALGGGFLTNSGSFVSREASGYWWTATEISNESAYFRLLVYNTNTISRNSSFKLDACSIRCVKN